MIVGIAGNAVENVVGITLAAKGQSDLAISVIKNSVAQIAASSSPRSSCSRCFFTDRLTFVVNPVYIGALALTALALWQITGDGEAYAFEGLALVGLYVILARVTFSSSRELRSALDLGARQLPPLAGPQAARGRARRSGCGGGGAPGGRPPRTSASPGACVLRGS